MIITNQSVKANIVTLRRPAASILEEFHSRQKEYANPEEEKVDVIKMAAKLIRSDLKLIQTPDDYYPLIATDVEKNAIFLPSSLKLLLEGMFSGKMKDLEVASIGQAMAQASRSRALFAPYRSVWQYSFITVVPPAS